MKSTVVHVMVWISTVRVFAARMNNINPVQTQINVLIMLALLVSTVLLIVSPELFGF